MLKTTLALWEELFSDDCEVLFNNIPMDKKSSYRGFKTRTCLI